MKTNTFLPSFQSLCNTMEAKGPAQDQITSHTNRSRTSFSQSPANYSASADSFWIRQLIHNQQISLKSPIGRLAPYLDKERIIRVGGRLCNAKIKEESKHPIILCKHSHFVNILLKDLYNLHHHASARVLMALTAEEFYISGLRSLARKAVHECVPCRERMLLRVLSKWANYLPTESALPHHSRMLDSIMLVR